MPLTKSAIKKVRVDKKRTTQNIPLKGKLKSSLKEVRTSPTLANLGKVFSAMDLAVKHHLVNKRHASRLKSRVAKIVKAAPTK